jgi:carbonic anhydrase/acetyltransferase-like protein (isoleucine patch superfamily)
MTDIILSGVTIDDGTVITARSVVTKDAPHYAIVGGNPIKVLKYRFDQKSIQKRLEIKWWGWEIGEIKKSMPKLLDNDINSFIN